MFTLTFVISSFLLLVHHTEAREPWEPDPDGFKVMPYPFSTYIRPNLEVAKDGVSVVVPDEYWSTAQYFNLRHSADLWKFLESPLPSVSKLKPLENWVINATEQYPSLQELSLIVTNGIVKPNINGMNRAYATWRYMAQMDTPSLYCTCKSPANCSPKEQAYQMQEQPPWQWGVQAYFDLIVDMLNNKTMVPRLQALEVSDKPPQEEDKLIAKAADIPFPPTQNLHLQLIKLQYALYQQLVRGDNDCPVPVVVCGKHGSNPCDSYPPTNTTTAV